MKKRKTSLPDSFKPLMWSYRFDKIDPAKNPKTVITQVLNYGDLDHWRWIKKFYGTQKIKQVIGAMPQSELRPQAKKLTFLLLNIKISPYASRSVKRRR